MSEEIYVLLLRLYPAHFRERYGAEALQLFRDRAREEQGFFPRLWLWLDVLADLIVSVPREYHYLPELAGGSSRQRLAGVPSFEVLEDGYPRFGSLLLGGMVSLAALAACLASINSLGGSRPVGGSVPRDRARAAVQSSAFGNAIAQSAQASSEESVADGAPPPIRQSKAQSAGGVWAQANGDANPDATERQRVIDRTVANLKQFYFDRSIAEKTADALLAHENNGDDKDATDGAAFAALLTTQMRDASHDMHLVIEYSQNPLPSGPPVETAADRARFREAMLEQHCMIRKAEILPRDIGYLKLDYFPEPTVCGAEVKRAMAALNHASAIIFDLRDNSGGFSVTVSLVASYLFDHPEYMYGPRGAPTVDSWTRSPVAGNMLADKPVYVLTSGSTWSGAEQFSYDLKMLKRATLVGETTRGGAHAGVFHRIDDHFGMGIPEQKPINPFEDVDWEGVGVQPNVRVKEADALETAMKLAEDTLRNK
jgi:Peptidase family S41